jgi:methionine sulfoxide reductase heme-binding subunit
MTPAELPVAVPGLWYLNRATGIVLLVVLTLTVLIGLIASSRTTPRWWPRFASAGLHANLAVLTVSLLLAHIATAVMDGFVDIRWQDAVLPFSGTYRPLWLGLGTLASNLLGAVVLSSVVRHAVGLRIWRHTHQLVYVAWPVAVLHGLGTGSDTTRPMVLWLTLGCVFAVGGSVAWRFSVSERGAGTRLSVAATALLLPAFLSLWLLSPTGPLHPGWADRAGTPASSGGAP